MILLRHNMKASMVVHALPARLSLMLRVTSLSFNRFWKWFEGVVFQTGSEMLSCSLRSTAKSAVGSREEIRLQLQRRGSSTGGVLITVWAKKVSLIILQ